MYIFLILVHVVACLVLILVVLLQAGRGGGVSGMMGGGQPQSIFGTQTNTFMTRATEVCAVVFIVTSLSLGILSTRQGKSLVENQARNIKHEPPAAAATVTLPAPAEAATTVAAQTAALEAMAANATEAVAAAAAGESKAEPVTVTPAAPSEGNAS